MSLLPQSPRYLCADNSLFISYVLPVFRFDSLADADQDIPLPQPLLLRYRPCGHRQRADSDDELRLERKDWNVGHTMEHEHHATSPARILEKLPGAQMSWNLSIVAHQLYRHGGSFSTVSRSWRSWNLARSERRRFPRAFCSRILCVIARKLKALSLINFLSLNPYTDGQLFGRLLSGLFTSRAHKSLRTRPDSDVHSFGSIRVHDDGEDHSTLAVRAARARCHAGRGPWNQFRYLLWCSTNVMNQHCWTSSYEKFFPIYYLLWV